MLNITADNASSNDTLVEELTKILPHFGGQTNRTRCFLHIVNLVAKSLLREFDAPIKNAGSDEDLDELMEDTMEQEDLQTQVNDSNKDVDDDDDDEGWVDEVALLSPRERATLAQSIRPISAILIKVRLVTYLA